jgi:hypothetical protein
MPQVKHIVLLKWKEGTAQEQIDGFFELLAGLKDKIPGILDFIGGPYKSPEGLNQGFNDGFIMTFDSPKSRDAYLPHPEHEVVKGAIVPHVEGIVAFDFEA